MITTLNKVLQNSDNCGKIVFDQTSRIFEVNMGIKLNDNAEVVRTVKEGLKAKDGYCPCRLTRTEDTKCICREFREQMADPDFEGYCHCLLYYKFKD